jgi:hypothetical protein
MELEYYCKHCKSTIKTGPDAYTFDCNPGNIRELENDFEERTDE